MGIKRYTAIADATITNAYKNDLTGRATASNSGQADSLEVFKIYGQANSSSVEQSRIVLKFPILGASKVSGSRTIQMDRTAETLPSTGVKYYLKLFDVRHPLGVPQNFKLNVQPVSQSWEEGLGVDLDEHKDNGPVSWLTASSTEVA